MSVPETTEEAFQEQIYELGIEIDELTGRVDELEQKLGELAGALRHWEVPYRT
jgi:hypothetical protein